MPVLHQIKIDKIDHVVGILILRFPALFSQPGVRHMDDSFTLPFLDRIRHEGEREGFTLFRELAHLIYSFINCHDAKLYLLSQ